MGKRVLHQKVAVTLMPGTYIEIEYTTHFESEGKKDIKGRKWVMLYTPFSSDLGKDASYMAKNSGGNFYFATLDKSTITAFANADPFEVEVILGEDGKDKSLMFTCDGAIINRIR